jgi:hypothetical protein
MPSWLDGIAPKVRERSPVTAHRTRKRPSMTIQTNIG